MFTKHTFTVALVAALASAQETMDTSSVTEPIEEQQQPSLAEQLFEKNEAGRWELAIPDLPRISFNDVDEQEIRVWVAGKEVEASEHNQQWVEAWRSYEQAVAQPWNDFVTRAEELTVSGAKMDMQTKEEVITFIAENTFVDGVSLSETFPQIESYLTQMSNKAENFDEMFDFSAFHQTPRQLTNLGGWFDEAGEYHTNEVMEETQDARDKVKELLGGWLDEEGNFHPNKFEEKAQELLGGWLDAAGNYHPNEVIQDWDEKRKEAKELLGGWLDAAGDYHPNEVIQEWSRKQKESSITYGYNPEIMKAWFMNADMSFEELESEYQSKAISEAQTDIAQASDEAKDFLDMVIGDLKVSSTQIEADVNQAVIEKMNELKAEIDRQAQANIDKLSDWLTSKIDFGNDEVAEPVAAVEEAISLAKVSSPKPVHDTSNYGYAVLGLGAAAALAYLYNKKQETNKDVTEAFIDQDEEYQQV